MPTPCFQHDSWRADCADCVDMDPGEHNPDRFVHATPEQARIIGAAVAEKLRIGDVVPVTRPKLSLRPAFTGPGKTSFKPARNGKK